MRWEHPLEDLGDGTVHGGCRTRSAKNCQNCCQMHCQIGCSQNSCPNLRCRLLGLQQLQLLLQHWYHWEVLVLQDWAHCDDQQGSGSFRSVSQNCLHRHQQAGPRLHHCVQAGLSLFGVCGATPSQTFGDHRGPMSPGHVLACQPHHSSDVPCRAFGDLRGPMSPGHVIQPHHSSDDPCRALCYAAAVFSACAWGMAAPPHTPFRYVAGLCCCWCPQLRGEAQLHNPHHRLASPRLPRFPR